jgi:hypothetical protein
MSVSVTNTTGTIFVNDGNSFLYIKKQKVAVDAVGTNVVIRWDRVHYVSYPAVDFTSPSGSASTIAVAIKAFLNT